MVVGSLEGYGSYQALSCVRGNRVLGNFVNLSAARLCVNNFVVFSVSFVSLPKRPDL